MNKNVRVRIAPSPTGFAHIGSAWMALFNYAFAKKHGGVFVLRIEDTDTERHVDEAEKAIYEGLHWIGIDWDEGPDKGGDYGPYRQSERLSIHQKYAQKLFKKGLAKKDGEALRFNNPNEDVFWKDLVRGDVKFPGEEVQDFVLLRSDGRPTYNFAVVVDDVEMGITHVIRGEEHISNTPKQIALYRAFGVEPPKFAHLPTLRNKDGKKLSKRRDPVDLGIFQKEGYLPEALLNFLCLLGWSHPEQKEIFDLSEFVKLFDLSRVRHSGPYFDTKKLDWINGEYIRRLSDEELKFKLQSTNSNWSKVNQDLLQNIIPLAKDRIKKLSEFDSLAGFFFRDVKVDKKLLGEDWEKHLEAANEALKSINTWNLKAINIDLMAVVEKNAFKTGKFFMDLRIAITGSKFTPPINESIEILGKEETLNRVENLLNS